MLDRMGTALFVTIAVMTVIIAITAGLFARNRSLKVLVAGIGLALVPLGLQLTGLLTLLINGIGSLIDWGQRTEWTNVMTWGAGLGVLGVLMVVVSGFLPRSERTPAPKEPKQRSVAAEPRKPALGGAPKPAAAPQQEQPPAAPKAARRGKPAPVDEELDEIEAILKKRGIV